MVWMRFITLANIIAALLTLIPYLAVAFFPATMARQVRGIPRWLQLACPAVLCVPYVLVACGAGILRWGWFALYAALPVGIAVLLWDAGRADPDQRGNWRD